MEKKLKPKEILNQIADSEITASAVIRCPFCSCQKQQVVDVGVIIPEKNSNGSESQKVTLSLPMQGSKGHLKLHKDRTQYKGPATFLTFRCGCNGHTWSSITIACDGFTVNAIGYDFDPVDFAGVTDKCECSEEDRPVCACCGNDNEDELYDNEEGDECDGDCVVSDVENTKVVLEDGSTVVYDDDAMTKFTEIVRKLPKHVRYYRQNWGDQNSLESNTEFCYTLPFAPLIPNLAKPSIAIGTDKLDMLDSKEEWLNLSIEGMDKNELRDTCAIILWEDILIVVSSTEIPDRRQRSTVALGESTYAMRMKAKKEGNLRLLNAVSGRPDPKDPNALSWLTLISVSHSVYTSVTELLEKDGD